MSSTLLAITLGLTFRHVASGPAPTATTAPPAATPAATPQCFFLSQNTPCGSAYVNQPILVDPTGITGFPDETTFNTFITSIMTPSIMLPGLAATDGCTGAAALAADFNALRYQTSFWCARIVYDAATAGCTTPTATPSGPLLCAAECSLATNSMTALIEDPTACPTDGTTQAVMVTHRQEILSNYTTYCNRFVNAPGATCDLGVETAICGFRDLTTATVQCRDLAATDKCCQGLLGVPPTTSTAVSSSTPAPIGAGPTSTGNATFITRPVQTVGASTASVYAAGASSSATATPASSSSTSVTTPVVITACVIIAFLIGVIITSLWMRRNSEEEFRRANPGRGSTYFTLLRFNNSDKFSNRNSNAFAAGGVKNYSIVAPNFGGGNQQRKTPSILRNSFLRPFSGNVPEPKYPTPVLTSKLQEQYKRNKNNFPPDVVPSIVATAASPPITQSAILSTVAMTTDKPLPSPPPALGTNPRPNRTSSANVTLQRSPTAPPRKNSRLRLPVLHPYEPTLSDELELTPGMHVTVLMCFDDMWGFGVDSDTGASGAFPLVCVLPDLDEFEGVEGRVAAAEEPVLVVAGKEVGRRVSSRKGNVGGAAMHA